MSNIRMYVCDTGRHTVLKLYALHIQYIHMYVHMYIRTNICTDVHIHICTYIRTYFHGELRTSPSSAPLNRHSGTCADVLVSFGPT